MFSHRSKLLIRATAFATTCLACSHLPAQDAKKYRGSAKPPSSPQAPAVSSRHGTQPTATIHWQRVPLRDALQRLKSLFDETVFVDRRVDPNLRVNLDIEASSAEEVVAAIAARQQLGVARMGSLVYLGPSAAAEQLRALAAARSQQAAQMPAEWRPALMQKQPITWPRLSEPREIIASAVERRNCRLANSEIIPHDLWAAGELPELTLSDQLTILLIGFDLTFDFRPNERSIEVVPLKNALKLAGARITANQSAKPMKSSRTQQGARHVYTLRVKDQPVRAVLQALSKQLHLPIQIDEDAIRAAGKSLDKRVSFSVENADLGKLLEALLRPAGLDYRLDGDRVRIIALRYGEE